MKISSCCGSEVYVAGKTTHYYVCNRCKQACDAHDTNVMAKVMDAMLTEDEKERQDMIDNGEKRKQREFAWYTQNRLDKKQDHKQKE